MVTETRRSMKLHQKCLVCEHPNLKPVKGYEKHSLVKCESCAFTFIVRVPTTKELTDHYKVYAYSAGQYLSPVTKLRYEELLAEMEPYRKHNKILDVGCGAGNFLSVAKEKGWEVYGTEFSEKAVEHCVSKGINIKKGVLDTSNYDLAEFDVITSFEVIEHINNPREEMQKFKELLRPGGLFYCTTPNFNALARYYLKADYNIIQYPEHLSYYTCKTLGQLCTDFNLKKVKLFSSGFSLNRITDSQPQKEITKTTTVENKDEKLRNAIEQNPFLKLAKSGFNSLLSIFGTGATLKAYYVKGEE